MIFLCGIPTESSLRLVIEQAQELGLPHVLFNQRDFADLELELQVIDGRVAGWMHLGSMGYRLEGFTGIYTRLMNHDLLPEVEKEPPNSPKRLHCQAVHNVLVRWFEIAPGRVLNRTAVVGSNLSKPYQAQIIRRYGFHTPETLVTNDPQLVREFLARHGRLIYKSVSYIRSIVTTVEAGELQRLGSIRWCPVQFQEYVEGTNVRVHVLDRQVFATAIHTSVTDYRYAYLRGEEEELEPTVLPAETAERCIALTRALGLDFAGVDLKIAPDGRVFCFEVNPCPAFSYFELRSGQPIARAVARFLAGIDSEAAGVG
jgi:hypothetical protein